jgi:hypothetical protein
MGRTDLRELRGFVTVLPETPGGVMRRRRGEHQVDHVQDLGWKGKGVCRDAQLADFASG